MKNWNEFWGIDSSVTTAAELFGGWCNAVTNGEIAKMKFELKETRSSMTVKLLGLTSTEKTAGWEEYGKIYFNKTKKELGEDTISSYLVKQVDEAHPILIENQYDFFVFCANVLAIRSPYAYKAAVKAKVLTQAICVGDERKGIWHTCYNLHSFCLKRPDEFERLIKQAPKVIKSQFRIKKADDILDTISTKDKIPPKLIAWANKQRASGPLTALLHTICRNEDGNNAVIFSGYVDSMRRARINQFYDNKVTPEDFYENLKEILESDSRYKIKSLLEYLIRQSFYYGGFTGQMQEAIELRDYIRLAKGKNLPFEHYPANVYKAHNIMIRNAASLNLTEEQAAKFKEISLRNKRYEGEYEDYVVVMPTKAEDVVMEGNALNHCVAGYVPMILNEETIVGFLRLKSDPTASLYTIEISGHKVIQAKGQFDTDVPVEIQDIIRHFERSWAARAI